MTRRPIPDGWTDLGDGVPWPATPYTAGDPSTARRVVIRPAGRDHEHLAVWLHGADVTDRHDGRLLVTLYHPTLRDNDGKAVLLAIAAITPTSRRWRGAGFTAHGMLDGLRVWSPQEAQAAAADAEWLWLPAHGPGPDDALNDQPLIGPSVRNVMFANVHVTTR
ncbi:hypothetical protein DVS28_b0236 (plasmid) [Euzebya pacifica]|uniref:Uncharacterized protein n=1 Tax=Euzebya pacifica TaxID=1608957 RepID=A0A346Y6A9_9ACTN|nr:hypothetical protein [Euzebya pacifica]AXV10006.1 hypothetical protein DVS28_b0236 [Euzebya pacifica]